MLLFTAPKLRKMQWNSSSRQKKTAHQLDMLKLMFEELNQPIDANFREMAVQRTGLEWHQIYKWAFDQGSKLDYN